MRTSEVIMMGFLLIMLGFAAGFDVVSTYGFHEAWEQYLDHRFQMVLSISCLISGAGGIIIFTLGDFMPSRRRFRIRKANKERYK